MLTIAPEEDWWSVTDRLMRGREIPLSMAILIYGDLPDPRRQFLHQFGRGFLDLAEPDVIADDDDFEHYRRMGELCVIHKLIAAELRATGFVTGTPLKSPPTAIYPARWRVLVPDFNTSTARAPDLDIVGISILPTTKAAASALPAASAVLSATAGPPGQRRRPRSHAQEMAAAYHALLAEGRSFTSKKAAHGAVLERLNLRDADRGWGYNTDLRKFLDTSVSSISGHSRRHL